MTDYRLTYLANESKDEKFLITTNGTNFILTGDAGTVLEMKPVVPKSIVVDKGESIVTITKGGMNIRAKREPKLKQMEMAGINV